MLDKSLNRRDDANAQSSKNGPVTATQIKAKRNDPPVDKTPSLVR